MVSIENLEHPAVELKLPLDDDTHERVIPGGTTLFFWTALAAGTADHIPRIRSKKGAELFDAVRDVQEQLSLTVSIDGESIPLLTDSLFRADSYQGLAWWIALDPVRLPTQIHVEFETSGPRPREQNDPLVLWTERGDSIQWGCTRTSTLELHSADIPATDFATKQEQLWGRQAVYVPR